MRFTIPLMKKRARIPQSEFAPIPFKEMMPLKLRNFVSGKGSKQSDVCCIQEMAVMFACLKKNEFSEAMCSKEINSFQKCFQDNTAEKQKRKLQAESGVLPSGTKNLHPKQLNKFLEKFPQQ